jgi:hypothetical protein
MISSFFLIGMFYFIYLECFPFCHWNIFLFSNWNIFLSSQFSLLVKSKYSFIFPWYFLKFVIRSRSWNGIPFLFILKPWWFQVVSLPPVYRMVLIGGHSIIFKLMISSGGPSKVMEYKLMHLVGTQADQSFRGLKSGWIYSISKWGPTTWDNFSWNI